ncbi:MAG: polyprenyl synthetase family protein [Dermatophilaceae bacterium]
MTESIDLSALRPQIDAAIETQLTRGAADLAPLQPEAADLLDVIGALLRGGKRLRPTFLYVGYRAGRMPHTPAAIALACAMEFLQTAALLHDDVIDGSDTRRGAPTAHRALEARHCERGWEGDSARFGVAGAILAGNLCLGWADQAYDESGLPADQLARARGCFDLMRAQLMAGQYLDVVESVRPWSALDAAHRVAGAERMMTYKSAKYSIQHPLLIGADAAGVNASSRAALAAYGLDLGLAFQLRDDVLGVFGDPSVTGKPAGDDLREGKRTVLLAHTLAGLGPADRAYAEAHLGRPDLDDAAIDRLRELITASGAVAVVEADIASRAARARAALSGTDIDPAAAAALDDLVDLSTARSA